jgi:hypothetical protein
VRRAAWTTSEGCDVAGARRSAEAGDGAGSVDDERRRRPSTDVRERAMERAASTTSAGGDRRRT